MKHSEVRQHIIETASHLFYKNGYNSTGINEVISEAGIAKATLYNHFKSKEDICISYLNFKNAHFIETIKAFCESKPNGTAQVIAIFDFLEGFYNDKNFNGCWCLNTISEIPSDNVRIREEIQSQKQQFIDFINDLIKTNLQISKQNERNTLANRLYIIYEGAVAESHLHRSDWPITEAKEFAKTILN